MVVGRISKTCGNVHADAHTHTYTHTPHTHACSRRGEHILCRGEHIVGYISWGTYMSWGTCRGVHVVGWYMHVVGYMYVVGYMHVVGYMSWGACRGVHVVGCRVHVVGYNLYIVWSILGQRVTTRSTRAQYESRTSTSSPRVDCEDTTSPARVDSHEHEVATSQERERASHESIIMVTARAKNEHEPFASRL